MRNVSARIADFIVYSRSTGNTWRSMIGFMAPHGIAGAAINLASIRNLQLLNPIFAREARLDEGKIQALKKY